jgi:hypothetical protein
MNITKRIRRRAGLLFKAYNKIPTTRKRNVLPHSWYLSTDVRGVKFNQAVIVTASTREGPVSKEFQFFESHFFPSHSLKFTESFKQSPSYKRRVYVKASSSVYICIHIITVYCKTLKKPVYSIIVIYIATRVDVILHRF